MIWKIFYNVIVLPILISATLVMAVFYKKIRSGLIGRSKSYRALKFFMNDKNNDIVYWFHAASFGEFEQVRPVLLGLKEVEPKAYFVMSFFSPSGFDNVNDECIDCKIYLPLDLPWIIKKYLKIVNPKKLILAGYDVWPNLIWKANALNINTALFAARFSDTTSKLYPLIRNFYKHVYGKFDAIYTITKKDQSRLQRINFKKHIPKIKTLGNPRYDQVKNKSDKFTKVQTESVLLRPRNIIAGSVHGSDAEVINQAMVDLLTEFKDLSMIWVPHEPTSKAINSAKSYFNSNGFETNFLGFNNPDKLSCKVIIVDSIGRLSQLYWFAQIAYIGGGFSSGVHNVMEPAIARLPVFFGPRYKNFNEAEELISSRGAFSIKNGTEIYSGIKKLLLNENDFLAASYAATNVIHRNLGSSTRIVRSLIHD